MQIEMMKLIFFSVLKWKRPFFKKMVPVIKVVTRFSHEDIILNYYYTYYYHIYYYYYYYYYYVYYYISIVQFRLPNFFCSVFVLAN